MAVPGITAQPVTRSAAKTAAGSTSASAGRQTMFVRVTCAEVAFQLTRKLWPPASARPVRSSPSIGLGAPQAAGRARRRARGTKRMAHLRALG
jgi:hypothetical protein